MVAPENQRHEAPGHRHLPAIDSGRLDCYPTLGAPRRACQREQDRIHNLEVETRHRREAGDLHLTDRPLEPVRQPLSPFESHRWVVAAAQKMYSDRFD